MPDTPNSSPENPATADGPLFSGEPLTMPRPLLAATGNMLPPLGTVAGYSPASFDSPSRAPGAQAALRASSRFMLKHPAHVIALGFGSGLSRWAPGTVGSLWAWVTFVVMQSLWGALLTDLHWATIIGGTALLGTWASKVTAHNMAVADPGSIVIDEVVALWLVLWLLMPAGFATQLAGFVLFRFFDAVKFGPVAWVDEAFKGFGWKGAFGIMADDVAAAFMTLMVIAVWRAV